MTCLALVCSSCRDRAEKLHKYLEAAEAAWDFHGAALVAYRGEVVLAEGYGFANQTFDLPNTPSTKFFIGSITKQFTAAAILKLRDQGRLRLNDPISDYLPNFLDSAAAGITIHQLLTHTSGLANYTDLPEVNMSRNRPMPPDQIMAIIASQPLEFAPGTGFKYSNSGYIVLGAIIEKISGQSYEAFLHREILNPRGLENTGYARRESGHPGRADGYTVDSDWRPTEAMPIDYGILYSAGALYSTVLDIHRWNEALENRQVLSDTSVELMFTNYGHNYGYGWRLDSLWDRRHASHGGFLDGFNSAVDKWIDDSLLIVVFSNADEAPVSKIARGLAAICLYGRPHVRPEERKPSAIEADRLFDYEGVYLHKPGGSRLIYVDRGALWYQNAGRPAQRLYYSSGEWFFLQSDNTVLIQFLRDSLKAVIGYNLYDEGAMVPADRIGVRDSLEIFSPASWQPVDSTVHDRFLGEYLLQDRAGGRETALRLAVSRIGSHLFAEVADFEPIEIFPISSRQFVHQTAGFLIAFEIDSNAGLITCHLSMGDQTVSGRKVQ